LQCIITCGLHSITGQLSRDEYLKIVAFYVIKYLEKEQHMLLLVQLPGVILLCIFCTVPATAKSLGGADGQSNHGKSDHLKLG